MRKAGVVGVLAVWLTGCASLQDPRDPWLGRDKAYHFGISAALAGAATGLAGSQGLDEAERAPLALGLTLCVGLGKEAHDKRVKGHWSWRDLAWDALGALVGYGLVEAAQ